MTEPNAFAKMVPGFDFLQGLVKNAGAALPSMGQWIAPTLDPAELEKRIGELRTVQFWLEQNAKLLGASIQALEVQRMTLATLKGMNVSLSDLTESLKIRMPEPAPAARAEAVQEAPAPAAKAAARSQPERSGVGAGSTPAAPGVPDPMQWWGALTQQFTELAANAMKDTATDAAKNLAGAMVKQGFDAASETLKKATAMPMAAAKTAASAAHSAATSVATSAMAATRRPAAPAKKKPAARRR